MRMNNSYEFHDCIKSSADNKAEQSLLRVRQTWRHTPLILVGQPGLHSKILIQKNFFSFLNSEGNYQKQLGKPAMLGSKEEIAGEKSFK